MLFLGVHQRALETFVTVCEAGSMALAAQRLGFSQSAVSQTVKVLESEYVTTARSKGLPESRVLVRHALRNAVVSTVSVLGVNIGYLVGGTLVIEQVYALPGVGQLMINSIFQRDFPVVQAVTLVFSIMVVLVYLLSDVAHALLDPRVRFE